MAQEGGKVEREEASCPPPTAAPSLCSNNCGFFGSAETMNLCSSCYKTLVLLNPKSPSTQISVEADLSAPSSSSPPLLLPPPSSSSSSLSPSAVFETTASIAMTASTAMVVDDTLLLCKEKSQPLRCLACEKKVGLRGFKCKCGDVFCALHRFSDTHACSFDYKAAGHASISKANPVVKADKLRRI